jgi:SAM-dependent methyltransferase
MQRILKLTKEYSFPMTLGSLYNRLATLAAQVVTGLLGNRFVTGLIMKFNRHPGTSPIDRGGDSKDPLRSSRWPKLLPPLSDEQKRIRADFIEHWLEILPQRYNLIEEFNHTYPLRSFTAKTKRTLEIGAGRGAHLGYEEITNQEYVALELRPELAEHIRALHPHAQVVVGDCQEKIDFSDDYFDRVVAIHVLEHLPDLPKALDEMNRVLNRQGLLSVVIPCEGGEAYTLARNISARRIFEKRYKQSYDWFVDCEHINRPDEIMRELSSRFQIIHRSYFPFKIPIVGVNLVIGLTLASLKE